MATIPRCRSGIGRGVCLFGEMRDRIAADSGERAERLDLAVELAGYPEQREQGNDCRDRRPMMPQRHAVFQRSRFGKGGDFLDQVGQ